MTKKNKENNEVNEVVEEVAQEQKTLTTADVLDQSKEADFPVVLVIGVQENGNLAFNTNVPQYQFMQHLLSKASFELHIHEKSASGDQQ